nr:hypothetical protein AIIDPAOG_00081 [Gallid alphaherpesvirus 2]WOL21178.1 hypothetical protein HIGPJJAF_00082 [Gallid alphaherpesvirus 2]
MSRQSGRCNSQRKLSFRRDLELVSREHYGTTDFPRTFHASAVETGKSPGKLLFRRGHAVRER